MATLERPIEIAAKAHEGQTDRGGAPYIRHCLRVMERMPVDALTRREGEDYPIFIMRTACNHIDLNVKLAELRDCIMGRCPAGHTRMLGD